jgi:ankyrin repeat protein
VLETVTTALSLGSDVNAVNPAGETALHIASSQGYDTVVRLLAEHGADLNVRNKRGLTPLGVLLRRTGDGASTADAGGRSRSSTVDLLRKLGAME